MRILGLIHQGRAAPYAIYDLGEGFKNIGHEVIMMKTEDILKMEDAMAPEEFMMFFGRKIRELNVDAVIGYGGTLYVMTVNVEERSDLCTIWDMLQIPYASIWFDSPTSFEVMPHIINLTDSKWHEMFVWDHYYQEELKQLGFPKVHYMPIAANTKRFQRISKPDPEGEKAYGCDVSFIGSYSARRELVLRHLLDFNLVIHGHDWDMAKNKDIRDRWSGGPIDNNTELNKAYNYAKININVTMEQGITSLNMRVFDVMAAGGFLISDYKEDFMKLFKLDEEVVCWKNVEELPRLVDHYLSHPEERKKKAWAGRRRVMREHSYDRRAEYIIEKLTEDGLLH
jgi:hypothetical protein